MDLHGVSTYSYPLWLSATMFGEARHVVSTYIIVYYVCMCSKPSARMHEVIAVTLPVSLSACPLYGLF